MNFANDKLEYKIICQATLQKLLLLVNVHS